jgi:DNA polymerase/3'-5' exonuclease PolX
VWLCQRAQEKLLHWNPQQGMYSRSTRVAWRSEEEIYAAVDLPFIEPKIRESVGRIRQVLFANGLADNRYTTEPSKTEES